MRVLGVGDSVVVVVGIRDVRDAVAIGVGVRVRGLLAVAAVAVLLAGLVGVPQVLVHGAPPLRGVVLSALRRLVRVAVVEVAQRAAGLVLAVAVALLAGRVVRVPSVTGRSRGFGRLRPRG